MTVYNTYRSVGDQTDGSRYCRILRQQRSPAADEHTGAVTATSAGDPATVPEQPTVRGELSGSQMHSRFLGCEKPLSLGSIHPGHLFQATGIYDRMTR